MWCILFCFVVFDVKSLYLLVGLFFFVLYLVLCFFLLLWVELISIVVLLIKVV